MMNYQEKEAQLDIYDVKKALLYRKAIGETELDRITVMALKELLEYKKIGVSLLLHLLFLIYITI